MKPNKDRDPEEELVAGDDSAIAHGVRVSLKVLGAILLVGLLIFFLTRPKTVQVAEQKIEKAAPQRVESQAATVPDLPFADITRAAGIDFVHENGAMGEKLLPETMGAGAAFFDYDDDGDADLLLIESGFWPQDPRRVTRSSKLYQNDGKGRFRDVSNEAGISTDFYGTGVAVGDYDGNGTLDLFLTAIGRDRLLKNVGGRFTEVTAEAGVSGPDDDWSTSATFFDLENDGDLDLFVGNYVRWSREIDKRLDYRLDGVGKAYGPPVNYEGAHPYLYRNDGEGRFSDVSTTSGIQVVNPATGVPVAKTLGVAPIDVDGDGFMDLFLANDTVRKLLLRNQGTGSFTDEGELMGLAYGRNGEATGAMGIDAGHFRNDDDLGFAIGNFANEMTSLYIAQGDPTLYTDEAITAGVGAPSRVFLSFGMLFVDLDLDGWLDLLEVNGHLESEIAKVDPSQTFEQRPQLFWNAGASGKMTFIEATPETTGSLAQKLIGRASAFADIDADGDLDLIVTQAGRRPILLRNDQQLGHQWLRLRLKDPNSANRHAVGAAVELRAGGVTQRRQVMPTRSYLAQSELVLTFGLGQLATIESLKIRWPDGAVETIDPARVPLGRETVLTRN
jgi:enediyne biosynthesis protein E4